MNEQETTYDHRSQRVSLSISRVESSYIESTEWKGNIFQRLLECLNVPCVLFDKTSSFLSLVIMIGELGLFLFLFNDSLDIIYRTERYTTFICASKLLYNKIHETLGFLQAISRRIAQNLPTATFEFSLRFDAERFLHEKIRGFGKRDLILDPEKIR